ncbi:MAG: error-prone DNA polymerase [Acidimicrobiales bacterium]|nr:error-prone DNA polymerase [Acidimicrobiales bacterium]MDP7209405.1 error-prone DNA polymerase [Acidimicrobiales bacterium]
MTSPVPYAELHCHSHFSFLDGASDPAELVAEASRLGLSALAITDHDGFYGVVRFAEAARQHGLPTVFGAELTVDAPSPRTGSPDPPGTHLVVLAEGPAGYARLGTAITEAQLVGSKGHPQLSLDMLTGLYEGAGCSGRAPWFVLTGCRKGAVPAALVSDGPSAARRVLDDLVARFGRDRVAVELWDHGNPLDAGRNEALARLAVSAGVAAVATNNVHHHDLSRRRLATVMAAVRARRSLEELDGWLPAAGSAHLRSGAEQARRFARFPGVVEAAAELGECCAFDLDLIAPDLPPFPCPDGLDEIGYLRRLAEAGASDRYGPRGSEWVAGAWRQVDHELAVIGQLGFAGYFLVVWDLVQFCRRSDIYCQGRGSAANSAVCYALGITNADAVGLDLLFERFLSLERDGPPDIDIDIESGRREEVIQYVYGRYGRRHTAQVANVITYRARSAVRDVARALGYAQGQQDAFAKGLERRSRVGDTGSVPAQVALMADELCDAPRHLGVHSGGMVICDRPLAEVCPIEWATMADRSVLQWDKEDCAAVGLVKFDLLGLGMLSALHGAVDLIAAHEDVQVDLARLPQEDGVYDMVCAADTIGVFQIESRAQMATLPRLRPRCFYDLVVEIALIRPGPIQGGSVHPYIRRRNGREPVTYPHPLCEKALSRTLGVPLFQEQFMQLSIDVAGFSASEADSLRQAMGSKRSRERMAALHERFTAGATERGVPPKVVEEVWEKLAAFSDYGFPESHSVSFAHLVYASCWIKLHHPAAFCAALLNAQPMGFYAPHTLVQDARRHGVEVHTPDLNLSGAGAALEAPGPAVRLGLGSVRGVGDDLAERITAGRPYRSIEDLQRRIGPGSDVMEALATAGAFGCFDVDRRSALWSAGALAASGADRLPGVVTGVEAPPLPGLSEPDTARADLWATGVSPDGHPTRFVRERLAAEGVLTAADLASVADRQRVVVAGVVTHRQRPPTAGGVTFVNLEDETGLVNVIVSKGCWAHHREVAVGAVALLVKGRAEVADDAGRVVNVVAEHLETLSLASPGRARDFR